MQVQCAGTARTGSRRKPVSAPRMQHARAGHGMVCCTNAQLRLNPGLPALRAAAGAAGAVAQALRWERWSVGPCAAAAAALRACEAEHVIGLRHTARPSRLPEEPTSVLPMPTIRPERQPLTHSKPLLVSRPRAQSPRATPQLLLQLDSFWAPRGPHRTLNSTAGPPCCSQPGR